MNGTAGLLLSIIMCKAMNRSFTNVLFGRMDASKSASADDVYGGKVKSATAEDVAMLLDGVRRVVCSGTRAPEMALRLKYAGWPQDAIEVVEPIEGSLDRAVSEAPARLFALPTYTALLELRTLLSQRGLARDYWE